MSQSSPILVVGFNRPQHLERLLASLELSPPETLLIALDGPRPGVAADELLVQQCRKVVDGIKFKTNLETRYRPNNLGLRKSIVDAVSWACDRNGKVIVLEDDVVIGPNLYPFLNQNLNRFQRADEIAHINGYNLVPSSKISVPAAGFRLTRFIESYAWATWDRAWKDYDDNLNWGKDCSLRELAAITESYTSAIKWKLNFADALTNRIDTWAYRWLSTIWSKQKKIISPNSNLVHYTGQISGTHTRLKSRFHELPISISPLDTDKLELPELPDKFADQWLSKHVFGESLNGVAKGIAISTILHFLK